VYCTARELARVIGKEKMLRLFFGPAPLPAFWVSIMVSRCWNRLVNADYRTTKVLWVRVRAEDYLKRKHGAIGHPL